MLRCATSHIFANESHANIYRQEEGEVGCRWGYKHVEELAEVVAAYKAADIPLDAMWTDIDYMDGYRDFTLDPDNFAKDKMQASCKQIFLSILCDLQMHVKKGILYTLCIFEYFAFLPVAAVLLANLNCRQACCCSHRTHMMAVCMVYCGCLLRMLPDLGYQNLLGSVAACSVHNVCCHWVPQEYINHQKLIHLINHTNRLMPICPLRCHAGVGYHCGAAISTVTVLLQAFVEQLHGNKQYWVPIVDPGIKVDRGYPAYDQGLANKAFITDFTGQPYLGQVGPLPPP